MRYCSFHRKELDGFGTALLKINFCIPRDIVSTITLSGTVVSREVCS